MLSVHYIDVIMTTMASQITSFTVVYSTVYSDADQRKHQSSASLAFPTQRASNAENVSIWWRHHVVPKPPVDQKAPLWGQTVPQAQPRFGLGNSLRILSNWYKLLFPPRQYKEKIKCMIRGKNMNVTHRKHRHFPFYYITWPKYSGTLHVTGHFWSVRKK